MSNMANIPLLPHTQQSRGRNHAADHDSSSSRENSPARKRPRSFSPILSDDDFTGHAPDDDDTPPPSNAPLLRQAFAFGEGLATSSVITYSATPKVSILHREVDLLPGQQVVPPPPPPPKQKPKRKPKKTPGYDTSAAFRVQGYGPTPHVPESPHMYYGNAPYNAQFRSTPAGLVIPPQAVPAAEPGQGTFSGHHSNGVIPEQPAVPKPYSTAARFRMQGSSVPPKMVGPATQKKIMEEAAARGVSLDVAPPPAQEKRSYYRRNYAPEPEQPTASTSRAASIASSSTMRSSPSRNHGPILSPWVGSQPSQPETGYTMVDMNEYDDPSGSQPMDYQPAASTSTTLRSDAAPTPGIRAGYTPRVVTVLISDARFDEAEPELQLCEVKVPCKELKNDEGFWADGGEVCRQMQKGPSRIDGPAKVHVMRGKFKHVILRVDEDQNDVFQEGHVLTSDARVLDMFIENLPNTKKQPPTVQKHPPTVQKHREEESLYSSPHRSRSRSPRRSRRHDDRRSRHRSRDRRRKRSSTRSSSRSRSRTRSRSRSRRGKNDRRSGKRRRSPSVEELVIAPPAKTRKVKKQTPATTNPRIISPAPSSSRQPTSPAPRRHERSHTLVDDGDIIHVAGPSTSQITEISSSSPAPEASSSRLPSPPTLTAVIQSPDVAVPVKPKDRVPSPPPDADEQTVFDATIKAIRIHLQADQEWKMFFRYKSGATRVPQWLSQFRFLQRMIDNLEGKAPFASRPGLNFTRQHVWKGMEYDVENGSIGCETLELLALYGENGTRYTEPQVIALQQDKTVSVTPTTKLQKRFLHLLRKADVAWNEAHADGRVPKDYKGLPPAQK